MARYKKGASARDFDLFGHKLPFYAIQPSLVKAHAVSDETLKSEYTRLRDIAQKRLKSWMPSRFTPYTPKSGAITAACRWMV